jgi:hypothetical protein
MKLIIKKQWQISKREKVNEKKKELLIETKGWWEAGQEEHEKQVWDAFDEPAVKPQLLYESHIFNQRFIVFQTAINYG